MNNNKKSFDWINSNNREQCEWAARYLYKYGYRVNNQELTEPDIEYMNHIFGEQPPPSMVLFLMKMKNAWTQKKSRDKSNGRKSYSFVMNTSIEQKLKNIARRNNINKTLESLIENTEEFRKSLEAEKNSYKEDLFAKLTSQKDNATRQTQKLKTQIENLNIKIMEYEIILKDNGLTDIEPTSEQKMRAKQEYDSTTRCHTEDIKRPTAKL